MSSLSVVNFSGRLFDKAAQTKPDGLMVELNYSDKTASVNTSAVAFTAQGVTFNDVGDQFTVSDTRGNVMLFYLTQNRYVTVAKGTKSSSTVGFISSMKSENVIVANSDYTASIYDPKGKLISTLKGHRAPIQKFCVNTKHCMLLSMSKDVINLWDRDKHSKIRSIFASNNSFKDCKFTPDGSKICTLFNDFSGADGKNDIYFWNVGNFESDYKITDLPKQLQLQSVDCTNKFLACGGKTPYLVIYDIETYFIDRELSRKIYKLPSGFERGITKIQSLRDFHSNTPQNTRFAFLTNGIFVVVEIPFEGLSEESKVDDSQQVDKPLKIITSIKLPHRSIKDFDIDRNNYYVSLLTSEGNVKVYSLKQCIMSDSDVTCQKLKGCSRDTISYHKQIEQVSEIDFLSDVQNYNLKSHDDGLTSKSSI